MPDDSQELSYQTLGEDDHPVSDPAHGIVMPSDDWTYCIDADAIRQITGRDGHRTESISVVGIRMSKVQKGIHICRSADGKARKVLME